MSGKNTRVVTIASNINAARERVEKAGFLPGWKKRVEASGELSLLCYREEGRSLRFAQRECQGCFCSDFRIFRGKERLLSA
jgi:hypothetical protein